MIDGRKAWIALLPIAITLAAESFEPPRWRSGKLPQIPKQTTAWGQVLLEVPVNVTGDVEQPTVLRSTAGFTERLREAVAGWCFEPAMVDGSPSPSRVLVGALFRPPTMLNAPGSGEPPRDVAAPSESIPFPTSIVAPLYPSRALGDGVLLMEVTVGQEGSVQGATVLRSAPGFDASALQAVLEWKFRPARRDAVPISTTAFLIFAFRQPVISR